MDGTPAHYREMARRNAEMAERATDPYIRKEFLKIARAYEGLADHAERLHRSTPPA
jgi:hypothetical protein